MLCAVCYLLGQCEFQKHYYCKAVTPITDLICALFGPYAVMFVNRIYPGKSLITSFVSPGKPWNLVIASPAWKVLENSFLLSVQTMLFIVAIFGLNKVGILCSSAVPAGSDRRH